MRIVMVDPGNYTAYYDANLCYALALRGHAVYLDTSEYLFESVLALPGYEVRNLFYPLLGRIARLKQWPVVRQSLKAGLYPLEMVRWAAMTAKNRPDIIHIQWSLLPWLDVPLYARLQSQGARLVYTVHDVLPLPSSPWNRVGYGRLYRLADQLVVHAEHSRQRLIQEFGVPGVRVHIVPMGGLGPLAPEPISQIEARARLGLTERGPHLLFFGLIKPYKGLDLLLEALALARLSCPGMQLIIAGEPMQPWGPFAQQIQRLGLQHAVHLHLGYVPSDEIGVYFAAADLVALPYREIYQSAVALTAFTFERPVVATRIGGLAELIQEGVNGFLAAPEDPEDLARVLTAATSDPARLQAMRAAVAALVQGSHSWPHIAELHEQIYENNQ